MARPGRLWWRQAVCLQLAGEEAAQVSVVVLGGQDQQEVWPHTGWKVPRSQGRQARAEQE